MAVLLAGVVISPPAYWFCEWMISRGWLELLEGFPFHRYFSRTVQVAGIVLILPLAFWLKIRSMGQLGIERNSRWKQDLGMGFAFAFVPMVLLAGALLVSEVYGMRGEPRWGMIPRAAISATAVSFLEEFFFRGVILGLAVKSFGARGGILFSAAIFAVVHFLKPAKIADDSPVTWTSGLEQLGMVFRDLPSPPLLLLGLLTLLAAGLLLALTTWKTRSLWIAIGMHAGWIFPQQAFQAVARFRIKPEDQLLPWIGPNVVSGAVPTGLIPLAVLLLSGFLIWLWIGKRKAAA